MPVLKNPKHELFAQEVAKGNSQAGAYLSANYKPSEHHASRLARNGKVQARIAEILAAAAAKAEMTAAEVLQGLARIARADIRKAVRWNGAEIEDEVDGDADQGGVPRVLVRAQNTVLLVDSDQLDDDTAACISEVTQTKDGLKIKFHDKLAAYGMLARAHGLFKDTLNHKHEVSLLDLVMASMAGRKGHQQGELAPGSPHRMDPGQQAPKMIEAAPSAGERK
jgi:phage terminase small subunit